MTLRKSLLRENPGMRTIRIKKRINKKTSQEGRTGWRVGHVNNKGVSREHEERYPPSPVNPNAPPI
jgi:hypothetical protein